MYYTINKNWFYQPRNVDLRRLVTKLVLVGISLFIGGMLGLYVAAMTMPLPHDNTPIYIIRK